LGALLGLIFQVFKGRKGKMPPIPVAIMFGVFALSWVLDGINSFSMLMPRIPSLYQTQNWTRLVTGTGMGLAISAILLPAFIQTMFKDWEETSSFSKWYHIVLLLALAAVLDVLILLEIPAVQYLLSLLSAASVLVLLTMIYSMVLVMVFKKENTIESVNQLFIPLVGGFVIGLIQIGAIDLLRYKLTGTWDGFNIAILSTIIKLENTAVTIYQGLRPQV
jgi:glucan phosphoethanolaminetransferase (alkaline phosphatase superfamily)